MTGRADSRFKCRNDRIYKVDLDRLLGENGLVFFYARLDNIAAVVSAPPLRRVSLSALETQGPRPCNGNGEVLGAVEIDV